MYMEYLHTLMPKYCCSIVLLLYCIFTSSFTFKTNNYTQSCFYTAFQEQVKQEWGKQRFSFFDTHFSTVASCRQSHDSHMGYHTILSICLAHRLLNEHVGLQKIFLVVLMSQALLQHHHCFRTVQLFLYYSTVQTNCGSEVIFMSTMNNLTREQLTLHVVFTKSKYVLLR